GGSGGGGTVRGGGRGGGVCLGGCCFALRGGVVSGGTGAGSWGVAFCAGAANGVASGGATSCAEPPITFDPSFCSVECPCSEAQGGCEFSEQCETDLSCVFDKGEQFGLSSGAALCLPLHCADGVFQPERGEEALDCGGACGLCFDCVDEDGDGAYVGCANYLNVPGPDCDDADP